MEPRLCLRCGWVARSSDDLDKHDVLHKVAENFTEERRKLLRELTDDIGRGKRTA